MRRALACVIGLVGLVLVAWHMASYEPLVVAGPIVEARLAGVPASGWPRTTGMRLHVFNTGMLRMTSHLVGASSQWRSVPAFVLEHPRQGLIIYDCGMSLEVARNKQAGLRPVLRIYADVRADPDRLLDVQMRAAGLDPERVSAVILSHGHFDHIGRVGAFPRATFYGGSGIRENHREELTAPRPFPLDAIPPDRWQEVSFAGTTPYATFAGSRDLFGDQSLVLLPGWGHTREDVLALALLPQGPVLLTGDAVEHRAWLESDDVERVADLPERAAAVRNQVRALLRADPQVVLLPGHDLVRLPAGRMDVVLHHPEWLSLDAWPAT